VKLSKTDAPSDEKTKEEMRLIPYRPAIGSLAYLCNAIRIDVNYAWNRLARYMENPGPRHWEAIQDVLNYLRAHPHAHISYHSRPQAHLRNRIVAFVDSDWAGDLDDRHSTTGYVIFFNGGPISWGTSKQKSPSGSTAESEYKAAYHVAVEVMSLRQLATQLGCPQDGPTIVHVDNNAAIRIAENPVQHGRMKHVDIKYHIVRKYVEEGSLHFQYVESERNLADGLTKAQAPGLFRYFQSRCITLERTERDAVEEKDQKRQKK